MVLHTKSLAQAPDKCCSGSPKITVKHFFSFESSAEFLLDHVFLYHMQRALSRKGSNHMERWNFAEEVDEVSQKLVVKVVPSQLEQLKLPLLQKESVFELQSPTNSPSLTDSGEGRSKRFNRFTITHPRKILLIFATVSSMGTIILIYFALAMSRRDGS
ncbi:uncharacterized protein [Typha latifolia]|uniref:uncharacterized protein isoform X1 n=1 Tax=Typha latifolia TaxID=4733 RepID=UPI003C2ADD28